MKAQAMFEYLLALAVEIGIATAVAIALYPALFPSSQYSQEYVICNEIASLLNGASNNVSTQIAMQYPFPLNVTISNGNVIVSNSIYFVTCKAFSSANETLNGSTLVAYLYKQPRIAEIIQGPEISNITPGSVSWYYFPGNVSVYITGNGINHSFGSFYPNSSINLGNYIATYPSGNYVLHIVNRSYIKGQVLIIKT